MNGAHRRTDREGQALVLRDRPLSSGPTVMWPACTTTRTPATRIRGSTTRTYSQQAITDGCGMARRCATTWQISLAAEAQSVLGRAGHVPQLHAAAAARRRRRRRRTGRRTSTTSTPIRPSYTAPLTDRLLVEAGFGAVYPSYGNPRDRLRPLDRACRRSERQLPEHGGPDPEPHLSLDVLGSGALVHAAVPRVARVRHRRAEHEGRHRDLQQHLHAQLPARRLAAVPLQQRRAESDHDAAERFHRRGPRAEHRHLRAGSLDHQAVHLAGRHPLRERVEQFARTGDWAVADGADADCVPGAGHREGVQRRHVPRWSGGRLYRQREDVAEDQRRHLHGSGAVGGHLHRAQSGTPAVRRRRAAADDPVLDRFESQLHPGLRFIEPGAERGVRAERQPELRAGGDADVHLRSGAAARGRRAPGQLAVWHRGAAGGLPACVGGSRVSSPQLRLVHQPRPGDLDLHADDHVHGDSTTVR